MNSRLFTQVVIVRIILGLALTTSTYPSLSAMQEHKISLTKKQEEQWYMAQKTLLETIDQGIKWFPKDAYLKEITFYCPTPTEKTKTKNILTKTLQDVYALAGGTGKLIFHTMRIWGDLITNISAQAGTLEHAGIKNRFIFIAYHFADKSLKGFPRDCLYLAPPKQQDLPARLHETLAIRALLHEIGHHLRAHMYKTTRNAFGGIPYTIEQSLLNEHEADLFPLFILASNKKVQQLLQVTYTDIEQAWIAFERCKKKRIQRLIAPDTLTVLYPQLDALSDLFSDPFSKKDPTITWLKQEIKHLWYDKLRWQKEINESKDRLRNEQFAECLEQGIDLEHPTTRASLQTLAWFKQEFRDAFAHEHLWEKITFNDVCKRFREHYTIQRSNELLARSRQKCITHACENIMAHWPKLPLC